MLGLEHLGIGAAARADVEHAVFLGQFVHHPLDSIFAVV